MIYLIYLGFFLLLVFSVSPPFFDYLTKKKKYAEYKVKKSDFAIAIFIFVSGWICFYFDWSYIAIGLVVGGNRYLDNEAKKRNEPFSKNLEKKSENKNWNF